MAQKPQKTQFLGPLRAIGDHIRKRRIQLGWGATQLAALLRVSTDTVYNWEHDRSRPGICFMPGITDFLGYALASSRPKTLAEKIKKYRIEHGLSRKKLAIQLGIDPLTVSRLENSRGKTHRRILKRILEILA